MRLCYVVRTLIFCISRALLTQDDEEDADVTANTTMPKSDEESEEEEEEEVEVEGDDAAGESAKKAE